jgi:hypothetical protein
MGKPTGYLASLQLRTSAGPPPVYATVANVLSFAGPSMSRTVIDQTTLDSPDFYMERAPGMRDPGEISMEIIFDPELASHNETGNGLLALYNDDTTPKRLWRILVPKAEGGTDDRELEFTAFVSNFEWNIGGPDENVTASITLTISGKVELQDETAIV